MTGPRHVKKVRNSPAFSMFSSFRWTRPSDHIFEKTRRKIRKHHPMGFSKVLERFCESPKTSGALRPFLGLHMVSLWPPVTKWFENSLTTLIWKIRVLHTVSPFLAMATTCYPKFPAHTRPLHSSVQLRTTHPAANRANRAQLAYEEALRTRVATLINRVSEVRGPKTDRGSGAIGPRSGPRRIRPGVLSMVFHEYFGYFKDPSE